MNWTQYFKLKEKQKSWFLKLFIFLVILNIFNIRSFLIEPDYICDEINITCEQPIVNLTTEIDNDTIEANKTLILNNTDENRSIM